MSSEPEGRALRPCVLVVENDPEARSAFVAGLEEHYRVLATHDGRQAPELVRAHAPDAILLDLLPPYMDGLEVLQAIRRMNTDVPVVVVSGVDIAELARAAARLGAFSFVRDRLDLPEVLARVHEAVSTRDRDVRSSRPRPLPRALVVGGEIGWRAAVAALLRPVADVVMCPSVHDAVKALGSRTPACAIVDLARQTHEARALLAMLGSAHSGCVCLVSNWPAGNVLEVQPIRVSNGIHWSRPAAVDEIFEHGRAVLAPERPAAALSRRTRALIRLVAGSYAQRLTHAGVAKRIGCSVSSIAHELPKAIGFTFSEYVRRVRADAALELLTTTNESQEEIALRVGLSGSSHLSRIVCDAIGRRPTTIIGRRARAVRPGRSPGEARGA
jgi:CheY-like chemotaxis protein/AraC-like DNA-binding protein